MLTRLVKWFTPEVPTAPESEPDHSVGANEMVSYDVPVPPSYDDLWRDAPPPPSIASRIHPVNIRVTMEL